MSKKAKQPAATTQPKQSKATNSAPRRKYLLWVIGLLLLAIGAYFVLKPVDKNKKKTFPVKSGAEPTLTAKNPRLQLLSPEETGVDFQIKFWKTMNTTSS